MTVLQEIIESLNRIVSSLDRAAEDEKKFGVDMCIQLEKFSWEAYRMSNNITEIKDTVEA